MESPGPFLSEHHRREFLDRLPVAAYTCDADGLITFFNRHAEQAWGRAPALRDLADRYCGSFKLFKRDGTPVSHSECWMALALRDAREYSAQEIVIERPDGSRRTVLAHACPYFDEGGKLLGAVNMLVDVSDRRNAEEAHSLLAAIVESSEDAIVSKSLEGRILSWNAGAERVFGYTAAEAIGSPITMIIPPERLWEEESILARIRAGLRIEHYETERVSKDGRRLSISLSISPVRDGQGHVVGVSKVARDITARKKADLALMALKEELDVQLNDLRRLHAMSTRLANSLELQPILDETLRTAAAIAGTDRGLLSLRDGDEPRLRVGALLGFDAAFCNAVEPVSTARVACGACFGGRTRVVVEDTEADPLFAPFRHLARQYGFRAIHSTPLLTRAGSVIGVLSLHFANPCRPSTRTMDLIDLCARHACDFIENAQLYDRLLEADRRKDEFLATLAHELRNPLAPISNSIQLLKLVDDLPPPLERLRDIMDQQVGHLTRLVDDLLEVSRITRGRVELRKEPVELAAVVQTAVATSRPWIDAAGHRFAVSLPQEPLTVEGDPVRLAQVVSNLLNNAAKYTDEGGQIWLSVRREGREAVISVRDSGVGIPAEMLPRVFDMFAQVDRTLDRAQGGLGIGLALAKSLVRLHGGRIEAASAGPGQGSEFCIRLPRAWRTPRLPMVDNPQQAVRPSIPSRRVLVVDDMRAAALVLAELLKKLGQQVETAGDAETALKLALETRPEIIISDIGMPGMDGHALARRVRATPELAGVFLVALSGYGQERDRQQARQAGFDHHLVKPVGLKGLEELLAFVAAEEDASPAAEES